jgi:heme/copper-type cytochrome/quinol oxidase subunit 2
MKDERPRTKERVKVTLWTLIVPPTTWAAHFLFSYLWAAISCAKVGEFATFPTLFVVGTAIALVVIATSGWIAWRQSRVPGDAPPHQDSTDVDRLRFLAVSTMLLAGLSFIAVIYTALPVVFIATCR